MRRVILSAAVFVASCAVAVVWYMTAGWSLLESVYMVVITVSGIGYGEVRPVDDPSLRGFTIAFIVISRLSAFLFVGTLVQLVAEGEIRRFVGARRMSQEIDRLQDHIVICGFGRVGQILIEELNGLDSGVVIVDFDVERTDLARDRQLLAITGDATIEDTLLMAGVDRAKILVSCVPDDAKNVFITLTASELNPDAVIIARAELPSTKNKLLRSGATHVVLPAEIGAAKMARLVTNPSAETLLSDDTETDYFNQELEEFGLTLGELTLPSDSPVCGHTIASIDFAASRGILVVAVRRSEDEMHACPNGATILFPGDTLVLIGHTDDLNGIETRMTVRDT